MPLRRQRQPDAAPTRRGRALQGHGAYAGYGKSNLQLGPIRQDTGPCGKAANDTVTALSGRAPKPNLQSGQRAPHDADSVSSQTRLLGTCIDDGFVGILWEVVSGEAGWS